MNKYIYIIRERVEFVQLVDPILDPVLKRPLDFCGTDLIGVGVERTWLHSLKQGSGMEWNFSWVLSFYSLYSL